MNPSEPFIAQDGYLYANLAAYFRGEKAACSYNGARDFSRRFGEAHPRQEHASYLDDAGRKEFFLVDFIARNHPDYDGTHECYVRLTRRVASERAASARSFAAEAAALHSAPQPEVPSRLGT